MLTRKSVFFLISKFAQKNQLAVQVSWLYSVCCQITIDSTLLHASKPLFKIYSMPDLDNDQHVADKAEMRLEALEGM